MKKTVWFTLAVLIVCFSASAQEKNKKIVDERFEREVLIGHCDRDGLQESEFGETFTDEYTAYTPKGKFIKRIKRSAADYSITMVLGTWCRDSKEQVPRFYRILDEAERLPALKEVICVDGWKKCPDVPVSQLGIEFVPTFIFFRDGIEIGRIVEHPEQSLEKDFYSIIKQ